MLSGTRQHLRQFVWFTPYIGIGPDGAATYSGADISAAARVVDSVKVIRTREGEEKVSTCQVYLDGAATITYRDRLTLPDGSTQPPILRIDSFPGPDSAASYLKVVYT